MNIEQIYLDKIWSIVNKGITEGELMLSGNDQDKIENTLEAYHQAKLKLMGISIVVGQSEQLKDLETPTFEQWKKDNLEHNNQIGGKYKHKTGWKTDEELERIYERQYFF